MFLAFRCAHPSVSDHRGPGEVRVSMSRDLRGDGSDRFVNAVTAACYDRTATRGRLKERVSKALDRGWQHERGCELVLLSEELMADST